MNMDSCNCNQQISHTCSFPDLFMINNIFYLLRHLTRDDEDEESADDAEVFHLDLKWFDSKVRAVYIAQKGKYLAHWETINRHLTSIETADGQFHYRKNKKNKLLQADDGKLFKDRFREFNKEFQRVYDIHKKLNVVDPGLRKELQNEVKNVFLRRYTKFFDRYSQYRFSKKHQSFYLKWEPQKVDAMLNEMYEGGITLDEDIVHEIDEVHEAPS